LDTPGTAVNLTVAGQIAFLADGTAGLHLIDVSEPNAPALRGTVDTPGWAYHVAVKENHAFVADGWIGIQVVDITVPDSPEIIGGWNLPDGAGSAVGIAARDDHVFVAAKGSGFHVLDVSDPQLPLSISSLPVLGLSRHLAVAGDLVYLAVENTGVLVLDVSDPEHPLRLGTMEFSGQGRYIALNEMNAFVASGNAGLRIFALQCDPGGPTAVTAPRLPTDGLLSAHPNPFNPLTTINFTVVQTGHARVAVYDMAGHRVAVLVDQVYGAGEHTVSWNGLDQAGRALSSGAYLVRLETTHNAESKKIMLVR
jgi:hypothetical protein